MTDDDDTRLAEIRARLAAITQPWTLEWDGQTLYVNDADGDEIVAQTFAISTWEPAYSQQKAECDTASAILIAHAPADLAHLLAEVERLTAENAEAYDTGYEIGNEAGQEKATEEYEDQIVALTAERDAALAGELLLRDATVLAASKRIKSLEAERDAERHHRINLDVIVRNMTDKTGQLERAMETASRSVDDWRVAWEQKQIELENAEAALGAATARAEDLETVIADAVSVGEMQGEDFRLQPWSTLSAALAAAAPGAGGREGE